MTGTCLWQKFLQETAYPDSQDTEVAWVACRQAEDMLIFLLSFFVSFFFFFR